jgi:hypothetical protein
MNGAIGFFAKLLISISIMAVFLLPVVDWSKKNALQAFLFPMLTFPWLIYAMLTVYFDRPRPTSRDSAGQLLPRYSDRSARRRLLGGFLFYGTAVMFLLFIQFAPASLDTDATYSAFIVPLIAGAYLMLTPRCRYCYRAYIPKDKECAGCGSSFQDSNG